MGSIDKRLEALEARRRRGSAKEDERRLRIMEELEELIGSMDKEALQTYRNRPEVIRETEEIEAELVRRRGR